MADVSASAAEAHVGLASGLSKKVFTIDESSGVSGSVEYPPSTSATVVSMPMKVFASAGPPLVPRPPAHDPPRRELADAVPFPPPSSTVPPEPPHESMMLEAGDEALMDLRRLQLDNADLTRRIRDAETSKWWLFFFLFVGVIVVLVLGFDLSKCKASP